MGLLKAGIGAAGGVLADQWREYFYCDSLTSDTLMVKGQKRSGGGGSDNIISDGSIIAVNEGQCMIIVQQGEIIEVCADPGEFVFEGSTEPSIFYGDLGEGIKASFERIGRRFTFAGSTANDQRVYFFNTKEIMGNKWGTPAPVPFRVVDANIGLDMDITVRANGEFSYRIIDPLLFYKNVCANVQGAFTRDKIDSQLKSEFLKGLQAGLGNLSALGIRYSAIPAHTIELADSMNTVLANNWAERGLAIASVGVNSITTSPEDEERIKEWQSTAVLRDPNMRAAYGAQKQGTALVDAANNEAGAMMGIMGMNMAGAAAGGMQGAGVFGQGNPNYTPSNAYAVQTPGAQAAGWTCPDCGHTGNTGNFCGGCGHPKPAPAASWVCPDCGTTNTGKFCGNCGKPKPQASASWTCPDCGTTNTGKFCGNCGKPRP